MPYSNLDDVEEIERQRRIDYSLAFSTEHGMRVLQDLLTNVCHLYKSSVAGPYGLEFHEGERNVGIFIIGRLNSELRSKIL